jgi:hypothetical protein
MNDANLGAALLRYNRFTAPWSAQKAKIAEVRGQLNDLRKDIAWYAQFDTSGEMQTLAKLMTKKFLSETARKRIQGELENAKLAARRTESDISDLSIFDFFSSRRRKLIEDRAGHEARKRSITKQLDENADEYAKLEAAMDQDKRDRKRYAAFDHPRAAAIAANMAATIVGMNEQLERLTEDKDRVDRALANILGQLVALETKAAGLRQDIEIAKKMDLELKAAKDSGYVRKLIHDRCEERFQDGHPRNVVKSKLGALGKVERDFAKCEDEVRLRAARAARRIRRLVIDGLNLCYESSRSGPVPIGLGALAAAVTKLAEDFEVIIVFDPQVDRVMRMSQTHIRARFNELATVHFVVEGNADRPIVELAEDDETYIVSNDGFVDYSNHSAVKNRRISHDIVGGRIMINSLDVNEKYKASSPTRAQRTTTPGRQAS